MTRGFRFGVALATLRSRVQWRDAVRRAEDLGYDVLHLPDHLATPAPLPALLLAAEMTNMRVSPLVLNAGFYKPALLARDAAALDLLTDHRFELGLGTGYVKHEFEAAELEDICGLEAPKYLGSQRVDGLHPGASSCTLRGVPAVPWSTPARLVSVWPGNAQADQRVRCHHRHLFCEQKQCHACFYRGNTPARLHAQAGSLE